MKILIRKDDNGYWKLRFGSYNNWFLTFEGASEQAKKLWKKYYKESAAYAMAQNISINLLTVVDSEFVKTMVKRKCKGITKQQYGYLKGIHERQEREW